MIKIPLLSQLLENIQSHCSETLCKPSKVNKKPACSDRYLTVRSSVTIPPVCVTVFSQPFTSLLPLSVISALPTTWTTHSIRDQNGLFRHWNALFGESRKRSIYLSTTSHHHGIKKKKHFFTFLLELKVYTTREMMSLRLLERKF